MARISQADGKTIKLEDGDIVKNTFDMSGKVLQVMVMKPDIVSVEGLTVKPRVDVLLVVDYTRGKGEPNVVCLEEITHVRAGGEWVPMKQEG